MDNDTKKILLLIARALQSSASVELAKIGGLGLAKEAIAEDVLVTRDLLAKINNEEKKRESPEELMDEIRTDWRMFSKQQEELMDQVQMDELQKLLWRRAGSQENNNA